MSSPYDLSPEPEQPSRPQRPVPTPPPLPPGAHPGWGRPPTLGYANPRSIYGTTLPNGWRAKTSAIMALVLGVLTAASILLEMWDSRQLTAARDGTLTIAQEQQLVNAYIALGVIYLLVVVPFMVFFLMWLYRAVKNIRITTGDSRSGPGMSVGWWFIPFANLVMPYVVLKDLWERARVPGTPLVGAFWALWIGSGVADRITSRIYKNAIRTGDWDTAQDTIPFSITIVVASIVSYVLLAKIIRDVQRQQEPQSI